jgi:hypothetical protein
MKIREKINARQTEAANETLQYIVEACSHQNNKKKNVFISVVVFN